jgi:hypothetical protein
MAKRRANKKERNEDKQTRGERVTKMKAKASSGEDEKMSAAAGPQT